MKFRKSCFRLLSLVLLLNVVLSASDVWMSAALAEVNAYLKENY